MLLWIWLHLHPIKLIIVLSKFWSLTDSFSTFYSSSEQSKQDQRKALSLFFIGMISQSGDSCTINNMLVKYDPEVILRLTNEICDWLESFLLSHDKSNLFGLFVPHEFEISSSSLFPLIIPHSVKFASHFENTFLKLFTCNSGDNSW